MTMPRPLLRAAGAHPLYDAAATARIEQRASAALPPHALMTRAGNALARLARAIAPHARRAWIAAGPGNNGGDGLVLATLLRAAGVHASVSLVGHSSARALPADAAWALENARAAGVVLTEALPDDATLADMGLCVDALLGVGHRRAPEGAFAEAIAALNRVRAPLLAVDLPTGLATDSGAPLGAALVRATHTLTLLTAKPGLFTAAGRESCGEIWFDDLGVAPPADEPVAATLAGAAQAQTLLRARHHLAHKGSFGDAHIVGGAAGMVGACLLAGRAAVRAGAGRVFVHARACDEGGSLAVDVRHPELMLRPMDALQPALRADARLTIVAGCGGGNDIAPQLPGCLARAGRLVLDADALNAIAHDEGLREQVRHRGEHGLPTILTPHPLEAARLLGLGAAVVQGDRLAAARRLARDLAAVVVLKGSGTVVATPDGATTINPTGDARLATAGTGDVLAGWIGGLWASQAHGHAASGPAAPRPGRPRRDGRRLDPRFARATSRPGRACRSWRARWIDAMARAAEVLHGLMAHGVEDSPWTWASALRALGRCLGAAGAQSSSPAGATARARGRLRLAAGALDRAIARLDLGQRLGRRGHAARFGLRPRARSRSTRPRARCGSRSCGRRGRRG
jgi:hydroxyethylthiazole kinase-like uncharacterized protein yjeF